MRTMKRSIVLCMVVLALFAMVFGLTACSDKTEDDPKQQQQGEQGQQEDQGQQGQQGEHQHSYVDEVVAPTCTQKGYTKHTCACGHSYTDSETAMVAHIYETTYQYPTLTEAGSRKSVCKVCKDTKTVEIEALSVALPDLSEKLIQMIGAVNVTLEVTEGSQLVYVNEATEYTDGSKGVIF